MAGVFNTGFDNMMPNGGIPSASSTPQAAYRSAQDRMGTLIRDAELCNQQVMKLFEQVQSLASEADALHRMYDEVVNETQTLDTLYDDAEQRVSRARLLFDRYNAVVDRVVASDGFTYERKSLSEYITGCSTAGCTPVSFESDDPITALLVPNRSLDTLLERLECVLGAELSPAAPAGGNSGTGTKSGAGARSSGGYHAGAEGNGAPGGHNSHTNGGGAVEQNALGQRVHPCIRVYGFCNYKEGCAYAKYPYEACLSNLKGKCRFKAQCHERHVEFRGPLDDYGKPLSESAGQAPQIQVLPKPHSQTANAAAAGAAGSATKTEDSK